jgi:hypothetical protein
MKTQALQTALIDIVSASGLSIRTIFKADDSSASFLNESTSAQMPQSTDEQT